MFGLYFRDGCPASYAEVMQSDRERFNRFLHAMLDAGVNLAPSAFEAGFVSGPPPPKGARKLGTARRFLARTSSAAFPRSALHGRPAGLSASLRYDPSSGHCLRACSSRSTRTQSAVRS